MGTTRLSGMLFRRLLVIETALPASVTRARVREFASSRERCELEAFRRRQLIGWRLSEANQDRLFQPEYGDSLSIDGARFVALVEPAASGSRIRGYVALSALTSILVSAFIVTLILAAMVTLAQRQQPAPTVLAIASTIVVGSVLMVRYRLRSTTRLVQDRLGRHINVAISSSSTSRRSAFAPRSRRCRHA